jgi:small nuclear ribonucleoprotein (snRNP)-like protein
MRIDINNLHEYQGRSVRVWLNGQEMDAGVIYESDEEEGYLMMAVSDKDGIPLVDPRRDDMLLAARVEGRVNITLDNAELSDELKNV